MARNFVTAGVLTGLVAFGTASGRTGPLAKGGYIVQHDADVAKSVSALKQLVAGAEGDSALARLQAAVGSDSTKQ